MLPINLNFMEAWGAGGTADTFYIIKLNISAPDGIAQSGNKPFADGFAAINLAPAFIVRRYGKLEAFYTIILSKERVAPFAYNYFSDILFLAEVYYRPR